MCCRSAGADRQRQHRRDQDQLPPDGAEGQLRQRPAVGRDVAVPLRYLRGRARSEADTVAPGNARRHRGQGQRRLRRLINFHGALRPIHAVAMSTEHEAWIAMRNRAEEMPLDGDTVINYHIQAINSYDSRAPDTFCVTSSLRHELKSKFYHILAVRLLGPSFTFCKILLSYLQIHVNAYA